MDQDEVIRRLKGLSRTETPPAPDFTTPLVAKTSRARFGIGPVAAVVGVLALGTAALAVPHDSPLRQAVASLSTEIETDAAEVEGEADGDESGVSGSVSATPCDGPPPTGSPADDVTDELPGDGASGEVTVEVDPEDREAQIQAWKEWREANCGPEANANDDADEADESSNQDDPESGKGHGRGEGAGANGTHPHADDPCKGPPPHSNSPNNGQPADRSEEERRAAHEEWKQWHHENCPPGQANDHPGHSEGHGRPEGAGKPDDAGKPDGAGRPDGAGKPDRDSDGTDEDS